MSITTKRIIIGTAYHNTLIAIKLIDLSVNSKQNIGICPFKENLTSVIATFLIAVQFLRASFMVAVDTEQCDWERGSILLGLGVSVVQIVID